MLGVGATGFAASCTITELDAEATSQGEGFKNLVMSMEALQAKHHVIIVKRETR
jgi:hypothetical protein